MTFATLKWTFKTSSKISKPFWANCVASSRFLLPWVIVFYFDISASRIELTAQIMLENRLKLRLKELNPH